MNAQPDQLFAAAMVHYLADIRSDREKKAEQIERDAEIEYKRELARAKRLRDKVANDRCRDARAIQDSLVHVSRPVEGGGYWADREEKRILGVRASEYIRSHNGFVNIEFNIDKAVKLLSQPGTTGAEIWKKCDVSKDPAPMDIRA